MVQHINILRIKNLSILLLFYFKLYFIVYAINSCPSFKNVSILLWIYLNIQTSVLFENNKVCLH